MAGLVLGSCWAIWIWGAVTVLRGLGWRPIEGRRLDSVDREEQRTTRTRRDWSGRRWTSTLGRGVRARFGRPADETTDRLIGESLVVAAVGWVIAGPWGLVGSPSWWFVRRHGERRALSALDRRVMVQLPDVAALLAIGAESGRTVQGSVNRLTEHLDGPVSDVLAEIARPVPGTSFAERLEASGAELGRHGRPLIVLLATGERHGAPMTESLHRLANEARSDHRRLLEEDARRMPVRLLGPLVFGILPAFFLLTVVPLVGSAASGLGR